MYIRVNCNRLEVLLLLLLPILINVEATRHIIYWDGTILPSLKSGMEIKVRMNEWMDISCPRASGGYKGRRHTNMYLQLYNVTENDFNKCITRHRDRVLLCASPEEEAKLTTKFQRISPSPLGFVFRPGQKYYYILCLECHIWPCPFDGRAKIRHQKSDKLIYVRPRPTHLRTRGCSEDVMKLSVSVGEELKGKDETRGILRTYHVINTAHDKNKTKAGIRDQFKKAFESSKRNVKPLYMPAFSTVKEDEEKEVENLRRTQMAKQRAEHPGNSASTTNQSSNIFTFLITVIIILNTVINS